MGASIRFQPSELDFEMNLRGMIGRYAALWERTSTEPPAVGITFTPAAQRLNENNLGYLVDSMEEELWHYPAGEEEQSAWRTRIFITLRRLGTRCFAFPYSHFDIIFSPEYLDATRAFVRKAHAVDDP